MARIFRRQASRIADALLTVFLFAAVTSPAALAQLYEQPVLVVNPGMHTAPITGVAVGVAGSIAVTGSYDKTLRVWSLTDGEMLRVIRVPAGPGDLGKVYAVAMNPDGTLTAAAGWMSASEENIYLFETQTGRMAARIAGLPEVVHSLAFSSTGQYLAVGLSGDKGLRVYARDRQWSEVFRDSDYGDRTNGVAFSPDGRLATASYDGRVRLYDGTFRLIASQRMTSGTQPFRIAFNPDGTMLAVGYSDAPIVDLLSAQSLERLPAPNLEGLRSSLARTTWSRDGRTLYAGGQYRDQDDRRILAWGDAGRGARRILPAVTGNTVTGLAALPNDELLVAAQDPLLALLDPDGRPRWRRSSLTADFRNQEGLLAVSPDGTIVDFGFEQWGKSRLRFDLRTLTLSHDPPVDQQTVPPNQTGLAIKQWNNEYTPTVDGKSLALRPLEKSQSLAIHPDGSRFVLGTEWYLRSFDAQGKQIWRRDIPSATWATNITGDGRFVIAAYGDGTIRWHRMDDGRELLALYVLADKQNWVSWTPEGFYGATAGAFGVLQWQVNRGFEAAADTVPVNAIPRLRRPDALALVLQEMETARALGIADLKAARRDVQTVTRAAKGPGARLHVLTIGISDYGEKAENLRLNFAARDAQDVASALVATQEGGLYAEVKPIFLRDGEATRDGIFESLAAMDRNMTSGTGNDLAVVMFSGHGMMIDNQFYLVPSGSDSSTMTRLKSGSISATEFRIEIEKLARNGRVLVLLDACRSAGLIGVSSSSSLPAADVLRSVLNASNVTVLTSSTADKLSREDEKWGHGAFTKALLDALSASDEVDTNHDGVISMSELTAFLEKRLVDLTGGHQQLGLDQRFQGNIFVAGL